MAISKDYAHVKTQVVFIHGLSGDIRETWTSERPKRSQLWPRWLAKDIPDIGIWLVGYPAAKTNWSGHGLPLSERADNILSTMLSEQRLAEGNIIFVTHSLGGLVAKQVLRNAQRNAVSDPKAKSLLSRTKRIAFLGTPHRGALLSSASAKVPFVRPTASNLDMTLDNPQLTDLNHWYRQYCQDNDIENLVLVEGKPEKFMGIRLPGTIGKIVLPSSADAGLKELPQTVDESHISISRPTSRESDVYRHVSSFIHRPFAVATSIVRSPNEVEKDDAKLNEISDGVAANTEVLFGLKQTIEERIRSPKFRSELFDKELAKRLDKLQKSRFFGSFDPQREACDLAEAILAGEFTGASVEMEFAALGWCARILAFSAPDEAEKILQKAGPANLEIVRIARALVSASRGNLSVALGELSKLTTPSSRAAAYLCVLNSEGPKEAQNWLSTAGIGIVDLDSDGKFFHLKHSLDDGEWDVAIETASMLSELDYAATPALLFAAADAYLAQAVPEELRMFIMQYLPFDAAKFPLSSNPVGLENRRVAAELYERTRKVAGELDLPAVASHADDKALWLRLLDPRTEMQARDELTKSIQNPEIFLRRLAVALQFGVKVDLDQAEQFINQQTALSGGTSFDAAVARFALASTKKSTQEAANYINDHRAQLLAHLEWKAVYIFEIEMLARSGQISAARDLLNEALDRGLTEQEGIRLKRLLEEVEGSEPVEGRLAIYNETKSIADLRLVVNAFEDAKKWVKVAEFGKILLNQTGDILDARRQVYALYKSEELGGAIDIFELYPSLLTNDSNMRLLRAQILFELGKIKDAAAELSEVRKFHDSVDARQLHVHLEITSGNWESLQGFVESEWLARNERKPSEILWAAQIAQRTGAARSRELFREAAGRDPDNARTLLNCYHAASEAGWEGEEGVHQWLERATDLSGDNGPIQTFSMDELPNLNPGWAQREESAWDKLSRGEVPFFTAAPLLNRSMLRLFLLPALSNPNEKDVRKRSFIYAYSGARGRLTVAPKIVAIDATTLITIQLLGLFNATIESFDRVLVPHNTISWLFDEKAKVLFHQPSQVKEAAQIEKMVSAGFLKVFEDTILPADSLTHEVGDSLAKFLTSAASGDHSDSRQRLVVRGGPVYKISSWMKETADLAAYEPHLCSCFDVVDKLFEKGELTAVQAEHARGALKVREEPWLSAPRIADGAVLYIDEVAQSHLEFLGIIDKLHGAGLTAVISQSAKKEADSLTAFDAKAFEVAELVESLRIHLRDGLASGKVQLGRSMSVSGESGPVEILAHPTMAMLKLAAQTEAGFVDDRYVNQHAKIDDNPLLSSIDLLELMVIRGSITRNQMREALTKLRRANYVLIPVTFIELKELVATTTCAEGRMSESAELKALKENVLRIKMANVLQSPKEELWLRELAAACLLTLKEQWTDGIEEEVAGARSDWLLELGDIRGWTHILKEDAEHLAERYRNWLKVLVMIPVSQPMPIKEAYWRWLDDRILGKLKEEDAETFSFIVEHAKDAIEHEVAELSKELENFPDE